MDTWTPSKQNLWKGRPLDCDDAERWGAFQWIRQELCAQEIWEQVTIGGVQVVVIVRANGVV